MPDEPKPASESPSEITKAEQAKWQGIVTGFVDGLILGLKANLQNMAIIGLAVLAGCNYLNSHRISDNVDKIANHAATKEDVADLQFVAGIPITSNSVANEISTETTNQNSK